MHDNTMLMQISSSGAITTTGVISGSNALSASYAISASNALSAQTASFVANAQSASNAITAQTASYASAFTVAGTLTAQTLVVQTITSSVDFVTGSTRFGSILGNTHVFSGSVTMNPGGLFVSGSGNVGLGNTNPTVKLQVTMNVGAGYPTLGVGGSGSIFVAGDTNQYGLYIGNDGVSGNAWLQSMRNNTATAYNIILNPVGGNVLIGTTTDNGSKLQVTGAATFSTSISTSNLLTITYADISTGDNRGLRIVNTDANEGTAYNISSGRTGVNNGDFVIRNTTTGVNNLIFNRSTGAATFSSSVTATSLSISSTTNSTSPGTGAIVSSGGLGVNGDIFLHQAAANGSNYGYIKTAATTVNTTTLTIGTTYGFGVNVDAVSFFNGAATFNGASTFNSSIDVTTNGSFGFQDYRTQATQKVLVLRGEGVSGNYAPSLFNIYTKPGTTSNGIASLIIKSKYGSEAESGNLFEFKGNGEATFGGNINANNIKTLSFTLQGLGTPVSTGLPINAYSGGRTYLLATSQQWSDGNSTSATITMIRCGYDGNNFSAVVLGSSNATAETWSQSGGILFVTGNTNFQLDIAVISNG
jgi:hypothetical protein